MTFVERSIILCPYLGGSTIGSFTAFSALSKDIITAHNHISFISVIEYTLVCLFNRVGSHLVCDKSFVAILPVLLQNMKLIVLAVSLGGVESLVSHPASTTHCAAYVPTEVRKASGVTDTLIRLRLVIIQL